MSDKKNEKYHRIIKAGVDIFTEKGFHQATVEEIARAAKVGKGTVYTYFENKNALFLAILEEGTRELSEFVKKKIDQSTPPGTQLRTAIYAAIEFFSEHRDFCIFLAREHYGYHEDLHKQIKKLHQDHSFIIREILDRGKKDGSFKIHNTETLTASIIGALLGATFYWFIYSDEFPVEKIYKSMDDLLSTTFCKEKSGG